MSKYFLFTVANKWNTSQNKLPFDSGNTSVALILPRTTWAALCKDLNVAEHGISIGLGRQTMEIKRKSSSKKHQRTRLLCSLSISMFKKET